MNTNSTSHARRSASALADQASQPTDKRYNRQHQQRAARQVNTPRRHALTPPPAGYADWLAERKTRIHNAQQRAAQAVNRELVLLYWQIGCDILERQACEGWGAKVIERLAHDLCSAFPEMKGFSRANLMYMQAFAEAWPDGEIVQQAVGQLPCAGRQVDGTGPGPTTTRWCRCDVMLAPVKSTDLLTGGTTLALGGGLTVDDLHFTVWCSAPQDDADYRGAHWRADHQRTTRRR